MTIEAGTRIGKYEVQSLIGEGGMGSVYRALDTELRRPVALKFLPAEVASDARRLERFGREALAVSALNHPNIVTVYDIGQTADGRRFFATELVEGVTLREHLKSRGLKLGEALDLVAQVAAALVEAHAHGIIHRDVKPENVMVRRDGYVKVLDFGLAKLTGTPAAGVDTEAATRALVATDAGAVMGTVAYMSPEQSRGEEVDARTDVWSLGVVLYEALTGHLPFRGRSASHTLVAIQDEEPPPLSQYLPEVPDLLQEIVSDALSKDRDARLTAKQMLAKLQRLKRRVDAGVHLDRSVAPNVSTLSGDVSAGTASSQPGATASGGHATVAAAGATQTQTTDARARGPRRAWLAGALAVVALAGLGYGLYRLFARRQAAGPPLAPLQRMKFSKMPLGGGGDVAIISPDGRFIARVAVEKSKSSLRLRQVGANAEREVVPPADVSYRDVEFSPDGNNIYYVAGETGRGSYRLYRVSVIGGDLQKLVDDVDSGVTFSPDGKRLAFKRHSPPESEDALVVTGEGGGGEQVVARWKRPVTLLQPVWSPDGRVFACLLRGKDEQGEYSWIEATALSDGSTKPVTSERWLYITALRWLPDDEGLVVSGKPRSAPTEDRAQIWYVPSPAGEAQKITNDTNMYFGLSLTADGRTALVSQSNLSSNAWIVPAGDFARARQVTNSTSELDEVCWTPDGLIVYSYAAGGRFMDLWVMNPDGTGNRQLTFTADRHEAQPALSPDGRQVVFETVESGLRVLYRMNMDGGGAREIVRNLEQWSYPRVSPDGRWVFYTSRNESGHDAFWKVPLEGGAPVKVRDNVRCRLSPDGGRLGCYYYDPVPDTPRKFIVAPAEGGDPLQTLDVPQDATYMDWSPDGRAIDFIAGRDGADNIWRLPLAGGRAQRLTDWQAPTSLWYFAWSRDGKSLSVVRDSTTVDLVLIQNFR